MVLKQDGSVLTFVAILMDSLSVLSLVLMFYNYCTSTSIRICHQHIFLMYL